MTKNIREERRKRALKTAERRKKRRDKLALERAEYKDLLAEKRTGRHVYTAKGRKGDTLTIRFEFSGIPVPVKDAEGTFLKRDTELAKTMGKLLESPLDH